MMVKKFFIFSLWLLCTNAYTQGITFRFQFSDKAIDQVIDSVKIEIYTQNKSQYSQYLDNGEEVHMGIPKDKKFKFKLYKEGYLALDTLFYLSDYTQSIKKNRVIPLRFELEYEGQSTVGVDVSAYYQPAIVFSSARISVSDYAILNKDSLILLAYPKRLNHSSELICFANDSILYQIDIPCQAVALETDYRNKIFLNCTNQYYQLNINGSIEFSEISDSEMLEFIRPVIDTLEDEQLFFTTHKEYYPAYDYYRIELEDTVLNLLHHVEDSEMMEQYRAEFKWANVRTKIWAREMQEETGIDKEIWVGANSFTHSIYYESPYGNLFLIDDNVYVFDFYKNLLFQYDSKTGQKRDSIPITFHKNNRKTGWQKQMVQDPITKRVYTFYDKGGYVDVFEVNVETGKLENTFTLFYRYPERIQIYDNQIYYIYRPFESIQKKYLYTENLKEKNRNLERQNRFKK